MSLPTKPTGAQLLNTPCQYCGGTVVLTSNADLYNGKPYGKTPYCYMCKTCWASTGVMSMREGSRHYQEPTGILADKRLKSTRSAVRILFTTTYKVNYPNTQAAYQALADQLHIPRANCNFNWMTNEQLTYLLAVMVPVPNWYAGRHPESNLKKTPTAD